MVDQVTALDDVAVLRHEVVEVAIEGRIAVAAGDDRVVAVAGRAMEDPDHPDVPREDSGPVGAGDVIADRRNRRAWQEEQAESQRE